MTEHVIETRNLTKDYGSRRKTFRALDALDLTVNKGEIFGYLGPNGAGKTTTIRMLLDIIRPTTGSALVFGKDVQQHSVELRGRIGFLPGELNLWTNERSMNIVRYYGQVAGGVDMNYVRQMAERLDFDLTKRVRDYSTGNKRKLGLILAMMSKPELLILDEPTSGLDPLMQQHFNEMMREVRNEGRTVFLSSHVLSEVQAICDRVAVLRHGQLKAVERVDKLTHAEFRWVTVKLNDVTGVQNHLMQVDGISDISLEDDNQVRFRLSGDFDPFLRAIQDRYVVDMEVKQPNLEEIFLNFYGDNGDASTPAQASMQKETM